MSLTLYYSPQSSASPVQWTLEELGVPYEKVCLDLKAGQQKQPEYLAINPNGLVPALRHDGATLFESAAIQIYLGETFGVEKGLYPPAGPQRAEALKWIIWCNVSVGEAISRHFRNNLDFFPADQKNPRAGEAAREDVAKLLAVLDQALSGRAYLLGDRFTLPDLHLSAWIDYVRETGIPLSAFANLDPWLQRCKDRPSFSKIE